MPLFLGIDTSNYTTSAAVWDSCSGVMEQEKKLLPVKDKSIGLRQSDAVFAHVKQLGDIVSTVLYQKENVAAIGVSVRPRDEQGSYMPCFLVGEMVAVSMAAALKIPLLRYSHQAGHIAAALYATNMLELMQNEFLAFHLSGGTTECLHVLPGKDTPFVVKRLYASSDLYAGQAVDRVGGMLGMPFPSGPSLETLAKQCPDVFHPRIPMKEGNPSISGLENQCQRMLEDGVPKEHVAKYCLSWLSVMVQKMTENALKKHPGLPVVYAGGVMSNELIRTDVLSRFGGYFAPPQFSSDNAAGIAVLCGTQIEKGGHEYADPYC